jgi:hypothetical protein
MSAHVPVEAYRSRVESIGGGIDIVMPSRRSYVMATFIGLWLAAWIYSIVAIVPQMLVGLPHAKGTPPPLAFLIIWTIFWLGGGAFALAIFAWLVAGHERVTIAADTLAVRREVFGIGFTRRYALASVRALRVVDDFAASTPFFGLGRGDAFGIRSGSLAFDYGAKTLRVGSGVDPAEAKYILSRVLAAKPALAAAT